MSQYKIDAELPFGFCVDCKRKDLDCGKKKDKDEITLFQSISCRNEPVCKNAVALFVEQTDKELDCFLHSMEKQNDEK